MNKPSRSCAIVLGGTADHAELCRNLRRRGYETLLIDYLPDPPARATADRHLQASALDTDLVLSIARKEGAALVVAACVDQALLTMCIVAEHLGLPAPFGAETARNVTSKLRMKRLMLTAGVPTAGYAEVRCVQDVTDMQPQFPLVVKPADCNGSLGIRKVDGPEGVEPAVRAALAASRTSTALVESFVPGRELSVDIFITSGRAHVLMVTETHKAAGLREGFCICRSSHPVALSTTMRADISRIAQEIVDLFKLRDTAMLLQVLVDNENISVIEIGARIAGGSKIHLIKSVTGFDIMSAHVDAILGHSVQVDVRDTSSRHATLTYVYCDPGRVRGIEGMTSLKTDGVVSDFYLYKPEHSVFDRPPAVSSDRLLGFLCVGECQGEVLEKEVEVRNRLKVLSDGGHNLIRWHLSTPSTAAKCPGT